MDVRNFTWQIILNPNALLKQSGKFWKNIENKLKEVQINYYCNITSNANEAKDLITNLCKEGKRHFIIAGGDGTINNFVNSVMSSQINSSEIFAALIPLGTGNDWSRSHGFSNNYLDAINLFIKGNFINHDVGLVETVNNDKVIDSHYFVNIAGFGFDGAVIANANKKDNKFMHKQLYLINLLKTLLAYKSQLVTLQSNDYNVSKTIFTIAVGIGQYNGNGMCQCPEAITNDGLLDVVMIEELSPFKVLMNINNLFKGFHVKKLKEASMYRTEYIEIKSTTFIMGEVEGETLTTGNYRIRCLPSAINFITL